MEGHKVEILRKRNNTRTEIRIKANVREDRRDEECCRGSLKDEELEGRKERKETKERLGKRNKTRT